MIKVSAIAAMAENRVIGSEGRLPWHHPRDLRRFAELTRGHAVLMGRKTYEALPPESRPLPGRRNIVVTRHPQRLSGVETAASPQHFIAACRTGEVLLPAERLWIIGGGEIYRQTLPLWDELYLTLVHATPAGDLFFPPFEDDFALVSEEREGDLSFLLFQRSNVRQAYSPSSASTKFEKS